MTRGRRRTLYAAVLAVLLLAGAGLVVRNTYFSTYAISADFTSATGIYPGDEVRVAGIKVGTVKAIQPEATHARFTLAIDRDVAIPADAKAVIVAQNLVSARYVQLTPSYRPASGPKMTANASIPVDRTAVPVEWDEVKTQLTRLAEDLGPRNGVSETSIGRFIDSAAAAMDGNGDRLREMLHQLAGVSRILASGSGNISDIIKNLQLLISTLRQSNDEIVAFQGHLATLSSVINDNRSDLDGALTNLSQAVGEVQRFVAGSRNQTAEQLQRLANVTQNLVDHKTDVENILHAAPNQMANAYNIYNPDTGSPFGAFSLNNISNPVQFICAAIGGIENVTAPESAKLCSQYLGPALKLFNFNELPFPMNPILQKSASPENIIYSDPRLAPGAGGTAPGPAETPPAVSAYGGLDGSAQSPDSAAAQHPSNLADLLLPSAAGGGTPPAPPQPADGSPPS